MNNLEQVDMFIAFLELVQNPAKYTDMLKEMKEQTAAYREYVEAYTNVKQANKYFDKLKAEQNVKEDELAQKVKAEAEKTSVKEANLERRVAEFEKRKADLESKLIQIMTKERDLGKQEAVVLAAQEAVEKERQKLVAQGNEMSTRLQSLAEKEAKLKAVLGS